MLSTPGLLSFLLAGPAEAVESEPNNTIATADPERNNLLFRANISTSTDADDYFAFAGGDGTFEAWLTDYGVTGVQLTLQTSTTTVATATTGTSSNGVFLSAPISAGTVYYLHVHATSGAGLYRLRGRLVWDLPIISSISASSGASGDTITLTGTDLGSSVDVTHISVGGAEADVTSASGSSVSFIVPRNGLDGEVELCTTGGCDTIAFSTGLSSFPDPSWYTSPDPADLVTYGSAALFQNRLGVSFAGNYEDTDADALMTDAMAVVTDLSGFTEVGYEPSSNTWLYELSWATGSDLDDYVDLVDFLNAEGDVDGLLPEVPAETTASFGFGTDVSMGWAGVQDDYAALDIIGAEETWRLLSTAGSSLTLGAVEIAVIDSGLRYNLDPDGNYPFNESNVKYLERGPLSGGSLWAEYPLSDAVDTYKAAGQPSHGTSVLSVIAATNDQSPSWDVTEAAHHGLNGLLAGVQQYGVDDDSDSSMDLNDSDGETFPWKTSMWNLNFDPSDSESAGYSGETNYQIFTTIQAVNNCVLAQTCTHHPSVVNHG